MQTQREIMRAILAAFRESFMGQRTKTVAVCSLILALATLGAVALFLSKPEPVKGTRESTQLVIDVAQVVKQEVPIEISSQGTVTPSTQTTLISEVSGRVVSVSPKFQAGGLFEAGEMLLQIDDRDYRTELKRAESAVASARSNLALEKGRAKVAYSDWLKSSRNTGRNPEADALAQRKPQLAEAQARLDSAEADLARARDNLDRTTIRLPYAGMVRAKNVDIGQYVTVGTQLGEAFAVDKVEIRLPIPDDRVTYLQLPAMGNEASGQPASTVTLSAQLGEQTYEWQAELVRTEGVLDDKSRVLFIVAEVKDPYGLHSQQVARLRVGTFVQASITGRVMKDIVVVPRHILRSGNLLWVVDENNRLVNRKVKMLRTEGSLAYIYDGLKEGERVSLASIPFAVAGTNIEPNSTIKTTALLTPPSAKQETARAVTTSSTGA